MKNLSDVDLASEKKGGKIVECESRGEFEVWSQFFDHLTGFRGASASQILGS